VGATHAATGGGTQHLSRAMKGWGQIFFYDPDGNIIEVHQVRE
jgi:catechol 2,3-dioxygenase-like lactoylglutathione lyase family enzyme